MQSMVLPLCFIPVESIGQIKVSHGVGLLGLDSWGWGESLRDVFPHTPQARVTSVLGPAWGLISMYGTTCCCACCVELFPRRCARYAGRARSIAKHTFYLVVPCMWHVRRYTIAVWICAVLPTQAHCRAASTNAGRYIHRQVCCISNTDTTTHAVCVCVACRFMYASCVVRRVSYIVHRAVYV